MTPTRVNELDLLRFVAAFSVMCFHYAFRGYAADAMSVMPYPLFAPVAKYGYLGLELFFMISGFVILMTASRRTIQQFVIARVVRLYPAFWVCCTITFVMTIAIGAPRYTASVGQYLVNLTMVSGLFGVASIDNVYWSLFVELIFYAIVAVALFAGKIHQFQRVLVVALVAEMALAILPIGTQPTRMLIDYTVCFIAGAECFLIWSQGLSLTRVAVVVIAWALAILQACNRLPAFEAHYRTSMSRAAVAGIITAFFLVIMLVALKRTGLLARYRWFLAGAITYPLYLLHENVGFMIFNAAYPAINPHVLFWGTIALVMSAAFAVHVFVEARLSPRLMSAANDVADRLSGRPPVSGPNA